MFRIAHISDLHCGSQHFVPNLMERAIMEINELVPNVVVCSGDLTAFGYRQEYAEAKQYLERLACETLLKILQLSFGAAARQVAAFERRNAG